METWGFSDYIPRKFNPVKRVWMELRTVVMWTLWIERNDKVFNNCAWTNEKLFQTVWTDIIDYGRVEWDRVRIKKKTHPDLAARELGKFVARRCRASVFATMVEDNPQWQLKGPDAGFIFEPP